MTVTPRAAILLIKFIKGGGDMSLITSEELKAIGLRLKQIQIILGYTNEQMAEKFGVGKEQYRKYCSGESAIGFDKLCNFLRTTEIDVYYLMTGKTNTNTSFTFHISSMNPDQVNEYLIDANKFTVGRALIKN